MLPGVGEGVLERCLLGWPMSDRRAVQMVSMLNHTPCLSASGSQSLGAFFALDFAEVLAIYQGPQTKP